MRPDREVFAELRRRLDCRQVAEDEGLNRRGRDFDCPVCARRLKARSYNGEGWYCVACEARGDAIDIIRHIRRLEVREALAVAKDLAGIVDGRPLPPPPPRRPAPPPAVLDPAERQLRLTALRLAAHHYSALAGWRRDATAPPPREHLRILRRDGLSDIDAARVARDLPIAVGYAAHRLRSSPVERWALDLLGVCPAARTGLASWLRRHGGDALVGAGVRAGLLRDDEREFLAGRMVLVWTDASRDVVYLTGRAVDANWPEARSLSPAEAPKYLGLPVWNPERRSDGRGVPRPGVPFGLAQGLQLADQMQRPLLVMEGEIQALAVLHASRPAIATGGTARTRPEDLIAALGGREAVVCFDLEDDPKKQANTDQRAEDLAVAIGAKWVSSDARREAARGGRA